MERPADTAYAPRKLRASDLRTPVTPGLRDLPAPMRDELRERRSALVERLHPLGRTGRRIFLWKAGRAALAALLITWLLTPIGLDAWWALPLFAAAYGASMAWWRLSMFHSGALLAGLGFLLLVATGRDPLTLGGVLSVFGYLAGGAIVGLAEDLAASDGE